MRKAIMLMATLAFVSAPWFADDAGARESHRAKMLKDPLCLKYFTFRDRFGNQASYKNQMFRQVASQCSGNLMSCKLGWDAALGRPKAGLGPWFKDSLVIAPWGGYSGDWRGKFYPHDRYATQRAIMGVVLWNVAGGADALVGLIDQKKKMDNLPFYKEEVYKALWYLGAKAKADVMIKGLKNTYNNVNQRRAFLARMFRWNLSAAQNAKIEAWCNSAVFQGTDSKAKDTVVGCLRYLGRIKTKNSDAKEFITNYIGSGDGYQKREAIRAVGFLKHKAAKSKLQQNIQKAFNLRTRTVRKRRKSKRVKVKTWYVTYEAIPSAIALVAMGDRKAMAPIKFWLGINEANKRYSMASSSGWEQVVFETVFAEPKAQKKLVKLIKKSLKKLIKANKVERNNFRTYVLRTYLALLQMGDKSALKPVLAYLSGTDRNEIQETLNALGAYRNPYFGFRAGQIGVKVGRGGLKPADAMKIVTTIKRRMKFWSQKGRKAMAIKAMLEIQANINAAK